MDVFIALFPEDNHLSKDNFYDESYPNENIKTMLGVGGKMWINIDIFI